MDINITIESWIYNLNIKTRLLIFNIQCMNFNGTVRSKIPRILIVSLHIRDYGLFALNTAKNIPLGTHECWISICSGFETL